MVRMLGNEAEFKEALHSAGGKLVLIDFFATWCPPCTRISPFIHKLEEESKGAYLVFKVDVDVAKDVAKIAKITCMPTFLFYKSGEIVDRLEGASEEELDALVQKNK